MDSKRFYFGSDHAAVELRRHLVERATAMGHELMAELGPKLGTEKADYPDVATDLCRQLAADPGAFGVLVCGTGQGMAMSANCLRGIRAAVCSDAFSAHMSRAHNDANVLCLGQRVVGLGLAETVFDAFAAADFEGGRHARRVAKLNAI